MRIKELNFDAFRKIKNQLKDNNIDFTVYCDKTVDTVTLLITTSDILIRDTHKSIDILFFDKNVYISIRKNDFLTVEIY